MFLKYLFDMFQLEQEILNFCEGLRVIGLNPEEKLALFADNSCRWLVSDQGMMLWLKLSSQHFKKEECFNQLVSFVGCDDISQILL